ncbi:aldehyde dehydrogenase family 3 member F1-like isoform X2 [Ziziphus jujuba]|uniref:Aldehyde dehydrogenase n=1 Tax=Ziziphus jujuba TaxID=326968 RepID=A0ABM3IB30_ZIZJJ|nr:aldehyde dehydrogenase family 3 member F1-like isoform X2 [Ziziphus jujuba]
MDFQFPKDHESSSSSTASSLIQRDVECMRDYYRSGITKEASWRKSQLKALLSLLHDNQEHIFNALKQDLGKHHVEAFRDEVKLPKIALLSTAQVVHEPLGLVLIFSSWNFPIGLSLEPLIGAVAAGNAVVLKPSELAPMSSSLLASTIPTYLDDKAVKVVQGGSDIGQLLLQHRWDKIFFTGSARVGKIVMSEAAKYLTPVTLELGGKCPAIVDSLSSSWDRQEAVKRIVVGKFGTCAGQACISVDYILVERKFLSTLVELMKVTISKMFGENPRKSNSIAKIVNEQHLMRLKGLIDDPLVKPSIVYGGSIDEDHLFMEPTILVDPPLEAQVMADEIFGPVLPIIALEKIEDSIEFINSRPKALALYVFTKSKTLQRRLISETSSGSVNINDAIVQYAADTLPFGGVGESGFGKYHGKFSFETFSHEKAITKRSFLTDFWFRYPPWSYHKLQLFQNAYNFDYPGMLLVILGLKSHQQASLFNN